MEYRAKIVHENVPVLLQWICEQQFLNVYNKFAKESEGFYKKWNAEYDRIFGSGESIEHYDSWIAQKVSKRVNEINDSKLLSFTVDNEVNIIGHVNGFTKSKIWFYIYEV